MPSASDKKSGANNPRRPCIQSMEIPPLVSKQPSRNTLYSSPPCSPRPQTPPSENLSPVSSYKEIFCTSQSCSQSGSCIKMLPEYCPFGLKENYDDGFKCTGRCHSGTAKDPQKLKIMTINSRYSIKTLDNEQQNQLRSCSGCYLSGMYTVKQSSSLQDVSSCCVNKAISPNQSVETPLKSPPCSPKATITFEDQSKNTSPIRTPSENKMPCCAHYEAMMQSRSIADVTTDTGTHPIPDTGETEMLMSDVKDSGVDDAASRPSMPGVDSKCCCPHLSNDARGSRLRTTFNLPHFDTDEPSHKVPPVTCSCPKEDITDKKEDDTKNVSSLTCSCPKVDIRTDKKEDDTKNVSSLTCSCPKVDIRTDKKEDDTKNVSSLTCSCPKVDITDKKEDETKHISCSYPESKKTKITKKCDCHFPPAFNKFCCTGNISGNCNCENED